MERKIEERIVKIPLPVGLIREIDETIVSGLGGYSTRTEFFRDAAEGLLLELKYEQAPPGPGLADTQPRQVSAPPGNDAPVTDEQIKPQNLPVGDAAPADAEGQTAPIDRPVARLATLDATALHLQAPGQAMTDGVAEVDDEPLFGMHNRDYPSLWVAFRLAERSGQGPVPYGAFVDEVTEEAWDYAAALVQLEEEVGKKLTALFPTNQSKPQSAREGFKAFAIGSLATDRNTIRAEGPLFAWRVCQSRRAPSGDLSLGITESGWRFLQDIDGISLETPHSPTMARTFLQHLRQYSTGDWWGFRTALAAVADQPTRAELIDAFQRGRPDWSASVAATNAQGYVARAREWGLVHPKQMAGRYVLTDFGSEYLAETEHNNSANTLSERNGGTND